MLPAAKCYFAKRETDRAQLYYEAYIWVTALKMRTYVGYFGAQLD